MQFIDPSWLNLTTSVILTDKVHRDKYFDYERKKYGSQDPKDNVLAEDPSSIGPVVSQSIESAPIATAQGQDLDSSALPLSKLSLNRDRKAAVSNDSVSTIPLEKHQQQYATKVEITQHGESDDEGGYNEEVLDDDEDSDIDDVNVFAQYTPDRAQAERDAADNPAWWSQINFPDDTVSSNSNAPNNDSDDFNSRQVDPSKAYRGFGRGILCAKTASE
jgi:hypothetical protein